MLRYSGLLLPQKCKLSMYNGTVLAKHSYLNISYLKLYSWNESDIVSLYFEAKAKVLTFIVLVKLFEQQFFYDFMFVSCATLYQNIKSPQEQA